MTEEEEFEFMDRLEQEQAKTTSSLKMTGNPKIDMAQVNQEQASAQLQASPLGIAGQVLAGAANTVTGGGMGKLERFLSKKTGVPQFSDEKSAAFGVGRMVGYAPLAAVTGGGAALIPGLAGKSLMSLIGQGAVSGGVSGGIGNYEDRAMGAASGVTLGALLPAAAAGIGKGYNLLKDIPGSLRQIRNNFKNIQDPATFGRQVRESLFESKKAVGDTIKIDIENLAKTNPTKSVDHSSDFGRLNAAMNDVDNPGLSTQVKGIIGRIRNPEIAAKIQKFIDNPSKASNVSLLDSQNFKVAIQNAPDIANKLSKGKFADYSPPDLEILDLLDNVKLSQTSVFPELTKIRKPYADFMNNYSQVKSMFSQRNLLNKVRTGFGNEEIDNIINTILPQKTIKDITGFRNAEKVVGVTKKAALAGVGAAGAAVVGRKVWDATH